MAGPLIPYVEPPELPLSFLQYVPLLGEWVDPADPPSIKPFGTLVAIGVYLGSWVTTHRARERHIDTQKMTDFIFWVVASGFVISHIFDALLYHPETVARDPLYLLKIWAGLSSYGGFLGAAIGAVAWRIRRRENILEMVDVTVSAFPLAWIFGRTGCAVVHDHPGRLSNAWYAVKYPPQTLEPGFDGRLDLGLIEMVLTIPLAVACWLLWRRQVFRPHGFYIAVTLIAYAPVRFYLDFLRVDPDSQIFGGAVDDRYGGLTPAQWACFAGLAVGLYFLRQVWGAEYVPNAPREPEHAEDEADLDEEEADFDEEDADADAKERVRDARPEADGEAASRTSGDERKKRASREKGAGKTKDARKKGAGKTGKKRSGAKRRTAATDPGDGQAGGGRSKRKKKRSKRAASSRDGDRPDRASEPDTS